MIIREVWIRIRYCLVQIRKVNDTSLKFYLHQKHHLSLPNSDRLKFFQMIAKNVGIRRASGKFVLATNIDVIINQKLYEFL